MRDSHLACFQVLEILRVARDEGLAEREVSGRDAPSLWRGTARLVESLQERRG